MEHSINLFSTQNCQVPDFCHFFPEMKNIQELQKWISFFVKLYYNPITYPIYKKTFFSFSVSYWPILYAFWIFFIIQRSIDGCYLGLFHKLVLVFFMSFGGGGILFFVPPKEGKITLTPFDSLMLYLIFFAFQLICGFIVVIIFHFIPTRFISKITKYLLIPACFIGSMCTCRLYKYVVTSSYGLNDNLLLMLSLLVMLWIPIIDAAFRKLTRKRTATPLTSTSTIIKLAIAAAIAFSLTRKSTVSQIVGTFPNPFVTYIMLFAVFLIYLSSSILKKNK